MVDDNYLADGLVPSYFIEGMLWNVPTDKFTHSYEDSFVNTFNWVLNADRAKLACANDLNWLVRDNLNVCWDLELIDQITKGVRQVLIHHAQRHGQRSSVSS